MLDFAIPFDAAIERLRNNLLTVPNDALYLFTHHCPVSVPLHLTEEDHTFLDSSKDYSEPNPSPVSFTRYRQTLAIS